MNLDDIRKIKDQIHWNMTPVSSMAGIDGVTITSKEGFDRIHALLEERAGYYFYIDVWNVQASLRIMKQTAGGSTTSESVDIDIPDLDEMLGEAIYEQGGAINMSGHYAISDQIREHLQDIIGGT